MMAGPYEGTEYAAEMEDVPARAQSPVEILLDRIDKACAVHVDTLQGLDAILAPAMRPSVPTEVTPMVEDRAGGSKIVARLTDFAERIESMTDRVRGFQQRLEV